MDRNPVGYGVPKAPKELRYSQVMGASITLLLYDHITSLDDEVSTRIY